MTAQERERLRVLIDQRRRELVRGGPTRWCSGCGVPTGEYTPRCEVCRNRYNSRASRSRKIERLAREVSR